ncbi:MAG: hypothetical protein AB7Q97_10075 [Gammaproteobacteria bacterium]
MHRPAACALCALLATAVQAPVRAQEPPRSVRAVHDSPVPGTAPPSAELLEFLGEWSGPGAQVEDPAMFADPQFSGEIDDVVPAVDR